jgi:formylglycine-generating enzyme required for sulfatase activity
MTQPLFIWAAVEAAALSAVMMAFACSGMAAGKTAPQVATSSDRLCTEYSGTPDGPGDKPGMVFIPGGSFVMGSDQERPEERFSHTVKVDGFWIDQHEVTNAQFAKFVEATGHKTLAERGVDPKTHPGMEQVSVPGSIVFIKPTAITRGGDLTQWWQYVKGANWREPDGPGSSIKGKENYPVVHVAYEDALAYAHWLGRELSTEAQWEYAARGGHNEGEDWNQAFDKDGKPIANSWQGIFPVYNTEEDGYAGPAPVGCFPPNGYGLYDMIGNVWEWTSDWYVPSHPREEAINPSGPSLLQVRVAAGQSPSKVIKGGSYLCASNYCSRYRSTARQPQEVDLSAGHIGFRTVLTAPGP